MSGGTLSQADDTISEVMRAAGQMGDDARGSMGDAFNSARDGLQQVKSEREGMIRERTTQYFPS